jgi:molybdopterin synthase sulfur carrier subunit
MAVTIRIPTQLRVLAGGDSEVSVDAATVSEALKALDAQHSGFAERLFDDKGELRRFVNIYLNGDDIRFLNQLNSQVKDGDDISIVPAIAGGE